MATIAKATIIIVVNIIAARIKITASLDKYLFDLLFLCFSFLLISGDVQQ